MTRRTIRIRIDLVGVNGEADERLAAAEIQVERDLAPVAGAGYPWRLDRAGRRSWKSGALPAFPRERDTNELDLLYRVLRQAIHFRNR